MWSPGAVKSFFSYGMSHESGGLAVPVIYGFAQTGVIGPNQINASAVHRQRAI